MLPRMNRETNDEPDEDSIARRRDAMLLRLLKAPPQSRAELAEQVRRAKQGQVTRTRDRRASARKPARAV
jgi:hypothetical protein